MKVNKENEEFFLKLVNDGFLSVANTGIITNLKTGKILSDKPNKNGYHSIAYRSGKNIRHCLVHRLVHIIYNDGFTEDQPICNHIDGNKSNNNSYNLERCSYLENFNHSIEYKLRNNGNFEGRIDNLPGENSSGAKLTDKQALEIILKYKTGEYSHRKLAKEYGMDHSSIGDILRGNSFKYLGV